MLFTPFAQLFRLLRRSCQVSDPIKLQMELLVNKAKKELPKLTLEEKERLDFIAGVIEKELK